MVVISLLLLCTVPWRRRVFWRHSLANFGNCVSDCRSPPASCHVSRSFSGINTNWCFLHEIKIPMKLLYYGVFTNTASITSPYPDFRELVGISVERYEDLVAQFVWEVLPQHLHVLCLYVQQVVTRPAALVHLRDRLHQRLRCCLHSWWNRHNIDTNNIPSLFQKECLGTELKIIGSIEKVITETWYKLNDVVPVYRVCRVVWQMLSM